MGGAAVLQTRPLLLIAGTKYSFSNFYITLFLQPLAVLVFAFSGILWACYPLLTIPVVSNFLLITNYVLCRLQIYSGDAKIWIQEEGGGGQEGPRWAESSPVGYIQQVVIKAAVHPYTDTMVRSDAFRGPLATAFKLHLSDVAEFFDR